MVQLEARIVDTNNNEVLRSLVTHSHKEAKEFLTEELESVMDDDDRINFSTKLNFITGDIITRVIIKSPDGTIGDLRGDISPGGQLSRRPYVPDEPDI